MRKLMLGMLLAAGAALPAMAMAAQDRPQDAHPRGSGEHRGGGRPEQPRPAPQAAAAPAQPRPQVAPAAPQPRPQVQAQGRVDVRGNGGQFRGNAGARYNGGDPNRGAPPGFRPDAGRPNRGFDGDANRGGPPQVVRPDAGQPNRGAPQPAYRGQQGGPGGYAPQSYGRGPGPQYRPGPGGPGNPGQVRPNGGGNWSRGWRGDRRYDWGGYRAQNRGAFHLPRYYAPPSWQYGYRRFSPGITLSFGLFDRSYWIDDAYDYRLPPAQWPYQWVRYYNDALLVDVRTGYVVDTVYDIFW